MLTQVGVEFEDTELILPIIGATPKSSLIIQKITGLNPPDLGLFIGEYSGDGGTYQGRRVGSRNVVLYLDLNPNPALGETVSSLRQLLYKAFIDPLIYADYVVLKLYDDRGLPLGTPDVETRVRNVVGYTEKFEAEPFDVDTSVQISMICPDPYIRDMDETFVDVPEMATEVSFPYEGTAETGFGSVIIITEDTPALTVAVNTLTDDPDDANFFINRMVFNYDFEAGDSVIIRTVIGGKVLMLIPHEGGPGVSLLGYLDPHSPWIQLHSASNLLRVYGTDPDSLPAYISSLQYHQAYWGV